MSEQKHTPEPLCPATLPFAIMDQEMKDLMRFHECVTDGEGYDVPKDRMKRLAEIGLLRRVTANFYEHTIFGLSIINGDFQQKSEVEKQRDELLADAMRYRWIRLRIEVRNLRSMSGSARQAMVIRICHAFFDTDTEPGRGYLDKNTFKNQCNLLDAEIDAAIEKKACSLGDDVGAEGEEA